jgi:hypothetical protein
MRQQYTSARHLPARICSMNNGICCAAHDQTSVVLREMQIFQILPGKSLKTAKSQRQYWGFLYTGGVYFGRINALSAMDRWNRGRPVR